MSRRKTMPEIKKHAPGTFCWADLGTIDLAGAKKFYGGLFGWNFVDQPAGPDMQYAIVTLKDKAVAAAYQMNKEMLETGIPTHWLSYVSVTDIEETAKKSEELLGNIIQPPFEVTDVGKIAVVQDNVGAIFAIFQPGGNNGAELVNEHGSLCWNELGTTAASKSNKFYTSLFGWDAEAGQIGDMEYTSFKKGPRPAAGMYTLTAEMTSQGVPPNWLVYFAIDDADAGAETIKSLGGQIISPLTDIPDVGRFAVAADPQGGNFAIIKLLNPTG
jgi:predicted enzyme related to lactoylglutathione lyase